MGANDKTEATFHGQLPGVRYGVQEAKLEELNPGGRYDPGTIKPSELQQRRLDELQAATEAEADKNAAEARGEKWWPIEPGNAVPIELSIPDGVLLNTGLEVLIKQSGENSRDHGFHEDFPDVDNTDPKTLGLYLTQKLMLMVEETLESFGEIRDGRSPYQTYFIDKKGLIGEKGAEYEEQAYGDLAEDGSVGAYIIGQECPAHWTPLLKPEGFLVEIADLFIRGGDLIFLLACPEEFMHALNIKHEYNKTRPFKHGRQF